SGQFDDIVNGTIVVGEATNATNSILNNDGTYSAFSHDANNILKIDETSIVSKQNSNLVSQTILAINPSRTTIYTSASSLANRTFEIGISKGYEYEVGIDYRKFKVSPNGEFVTHLFYTAGVDDTVPDERVTIYSYDGTTIKGYYVAADARPFAVESIKEIIE
ncbi:MAG: hypothetical protein PHR96_05015, partial [Clostridia bacterium]|nr:hypothetical protein [Clostridia bacterium]